MARQTDIRGLVERFAKELEQAVASRVNGDFSSRFDELRRSIMRGEKRAPQLSGLRGRSGPRPGYVVPEKPCPVCGKPTKARRFSYLCDDHRSAENLAKFKGKASDETASAGSSAVKGKGPKAAAKAVKAPKKGTKAAKAGGKAKKAKAGSTKAEASTPES